MTDVIARTGAWMLLQVSAVHDTIFTRQVAAPRTLIDEVTAVASGLISIVLLVLTIALVPAAWNFRKTYKKVSELLDRVYGDVNPIMRHVSLIAENVDYITVSIRTDIQQIHGTIESANQRLSRAMATIDGQLQEFHALMTVVQSEAEQIFVSTAAAVRGVRTGAAAFRGGPGTEFAMDALDTLVPDEYDEYDEYDDTDHEEMHDGNHGLTEPTPNPPAYSRLKRRARRPE